MLRRPTSWLLAACLVFAVPAAGRAADSWHLTKVQRVSRNSGWALASTPRGSVLLRTTNGGQEWQNVSPHGIWPLSAAQIASNENFGIGWEGIDCYGLSGQTCWVAMISSGTQIIVEQTHDGGHHWAKSQFANHTGDSLLLSFLDRRHGWLLTISDMASGSTRKELFRTEDGGQTWGFVTNALPDHIDPRGMTFRSSTEGWLAAGYHGSDEVPLYKTKDAGRHWHLQSLPEPDASVDGGYGSVTPPRFSGLHKRRGILTVDYRDNNINRSEAVAYVTHDGGRNWHISRRKRVGHGERSKS